MGAHLISLTEKIIHLNQRQIAILRDFEYRQKFFARHKQEVDALVNAAEQLIHKPTPKIYRILQAHVTALQVLMSTSLRYLSQEELERDETNLLSEERTADTNALRMLETDYTELWQNLKQLHEGEVKSSLMLYLIDLQKEEDDVKKEQSINKELQKILANLEGLIEEEKNLLEDELNILHQKFNFSLNQLDETKKAELSSAAESIVHVAESLRNLIERENGRFIQPLRAFTSQKYALNQRILRTVSRKVITLGMIKRDLAELKPLQAEQYMEQLFEHYQQFEPTAVTYFLRFKRFMGRKTKEKTMKEEQLIREGIAVHKTRAQYDSLGMLNRKYGDELLTERIKLALTKGEEIFILLIDADKFKEINDTYGHHTGDIVLMAISSIAQESIGEKDTFFRWGGEEFIVLFNSITNPAQSYAISEELRTNIEREARRRIISSKDPTLTKLREDLKNNVRSISVSAGLAGAKIPFDANRIVSEERVSELKTHLIGLADEALYEAKGTGRNKIIQKFVEYS
ncbi:diguanylate cyclase [Candidatus Woesearchaeota archaeon]|nr:diguanylate cyclase [Candidatus Woesearchaeota archaeon]